MKRRPPERGSSRVSAPSRARDAERPTGTSQLPGGSHPVSQRPSTGARGHELRPPPRGEASELIYGMRAGLAVIERRPDDVLRVACTEELRSELAEHTGRLGARGIELEIFPEAELSHLAGSDQHEGLLLQTSPRRFTAPQTLGDLLLKSEGMAVAFDRVRNPYNIGAVLRTAAFFGVEGALLGAPAPHPALPPLAVRVAEGGAEHLAISRTTDLADTLARLRAAGILIAGAEDDGTPAALTRARENRKQPIVLVLGHEREGLSSRVRAQCDAIVAIRGAGYVRSLNVSIAASILIADLMR